MRKRIVLFCISIVIIAGSYYFGSTKKEVFAWPKTTETFTFEKENGKKIKVKFDLIFKVVLTRRGDHIIKVSTEKEYFAIDKDNPHIKELKKYILSEENIYKYNFECMEFSYEDKPYYLKSAVIVKTKDLRLDTINQKLLEYLGGYENFKKGKYSYEKHKEYLIRIGLKYKK